MSKKYDKFRKKFRSGVYTDVFDVVRETGELGYCVHCGKKIWTKWNRYRHEMTACGPCYFKEDSERINEK